MGEHDGGLETGMPSCSREALCSNRHLEAMQLVECQVSTEVLYLKHSHPVMSL